MIDTTTAIQVVLVVLLVLVIFAGLYSIRHGDWR